ncbi:hypothetical protein J5N97_027750 [Dioscorea zingiberensis]|uniref:Dehydrogenase E1 component domain-containing protein n=1 Tax=Dioscorea zingiberensis TaxID=325984 RepID=A0A9D5H465_9LILI|nr:hypothetical protein J5N97_027750 [Dioscorea zingiberensis]
MGLRTLIHYAVQTASSQTIKIFLLYNVDINLPDDDGWTPLHLAVQTKRTDIVRLLLIKGADRTLRNRVQLMVNRERDPIGRIRKLILSHELATASELKDFEKQVRKVVDAAIAKAKESPMPDPSELFTNVYVKGYGVEVNNKKKIVSGSPCGAVAAESKRAQANWVVLDILNPQAVVEADDSDNQTIPRMMLQTTNFKLQTLPHLLNPILGHKNQYLNIAIGGGIGAWWSWRRFRGCSAGGDDGFGGGGGGGWWWYVVMVEYSEVVVEQVEVEVLAAEVVAEWVVLVALVAEGVEGDMQDLGYDITKAHEFLFVDNKGIVKTISDDAGVVLVADQLREHMTINIFVESNSAAHDQPLPEVLAHARQEKNMPHDHALPEVLLTDSSSDDEERLIEMLFANNN